MIATKNKVIYVKKIIYYTKNVVCTEMKISRMILRIQKHSSSEKLCISEQQFHPLWLTNGQNKMRFRQTKIAALKALW